ncbi:MAG: hypothetical protein K9L78_01085 [Victivallales bacterium]|nr:hypothetical protein [Victivallales bacterium]MCF7888691.1 hypothetical protein [Victivallales bacterium]
MKNKIKIIKKIFALFLFISLQFSITLSAMQEFSDMMRPAHEGGIMPETGYHNVTPSLPTPESLNPFDSIEATTGADIKADSFEIIGDNIIAKGNIRVRKGDALLYSDMVVINGTTKNVELSGNVEFYNINHARLEVEYWELRTLERDPDVKLKIVGTVMTTSGRQKIVVDIMRKTMAWHGEKTIGNLDSGIFEFSDFSADFDGYTAIAEGAKRYPDGKLVIKDAETSPCQGFTVGHSIFSIKSSKLVSYPSNIEDSRTRIVQNEYSPHAHFTKKPTSGKSAGTKGYNFWGYNNILYIGDIPVFWLPIIYKPSMENVGNWTFTYGSDTAWGYFVNTTNHWKIVDENDVQLSVNNMVDYYTLRGLGLGNQTMLNTEDTMSQLFVYGISDGNPNINRPDWSRFGQMPDRTVRYDITLKNMSHLGNNFDFRGQFAKLSDIYFLYDYFDNIALINPQPATFGNLEYNNQYINLGLTLRPKVNKFFSVIETLPELDLHIPRQEIWKGIHYQGQTSVGYKKMNWRNFQVSRAEAGLGNGVDPSDYEAGRFDTLHFAYYPLQYKGFNFIPRLGGRFTAYSKTSDTGISQQDLFNMFKAQEPEGRYNVDVENYDSDGGAKGRFIGEIGAELNTKLTKQWNDVKNSYWELDGIRHVAKPYINYTYIPKPSVSRDHLYYFDDIDRIGKQNFARFGFDNRFQTRRGSWGDSSLFTWASMETYLDLVASKSDEYYSQGGDDENSSQSPSEYGGLKQLGDIGHNMTFKASDALNFNVQFLLDGQRLSTGDVLRSINKLSASGEYQLAQGWSVNAGWYTGKEGYSQGPYSMGSSFKRLQAGSVFERIFTASNSVYGGFNYKINERTLGTFSWDYDFEQNLMPGFTLSFVRQLPCGLELLIDMTLRDQPETSGEGKHTETRWSVSLGFSSSPNNVIQPRESLLPQSITRLSNS